MLPLLPFAFAAIGVLGAARTAHAFHSTSRTARLMEKMEHLVQSAADQLDRDRKRTETLIEQWEDEKKQARQTEIPVFLALFGRLGKIEWKEAATNEAKIVSSPSNIGISTKDDTGKTSSNDVWAAVGAVSLIGLLAGGGAPVLASALWVGGGVLDNRGKKKKRQAVRHLEEARIVLVAIDESRLKLRAIRENLLRSIQATSRLRRDLGRANQRLEASLPEEKGVFSELDDVGKTALFNAVTKAQMLKAVLEAGGIGE